MYSVVPTPGDVLLRATANSQAQPPGHAARQASSKVLFEWNGY
jgi:hypothetical protein